MMIKTKLLAKNGTVSVDRNDYWNYYCIRISRDDEALSIRLSIRLDTEEYRSLLNNMIDIFVPKSGAKHGRAK